MSEFQKRIAHIQSFSKNPSALISLLYGHDDRTTAIMIGGFLEDLLALGIIAKFKQNPQKIRSRNYSPTMDPYRISPPG